MSSHLIKRVQKIPVSIDKVWTFFSDARNLQSITPKEVHFEIIYHDNKEMHKGQIIEYYIKPFAGMRFFWRTEITEIRKNEYFTDVQLKGPYRLWKHKHFFRAIPGGVEMVDLVQYKVPGWMIGRVINRAYLRNKLKKIFDFRYQKIEEIFGKWPEFSSVTS
jgi:ligand-binding SRPBCC domain-containing protein